MLQAEGREPLLIRYATPRQEHPSIPGRYHPGFAMWCVDRGGEPVPLIETCDPAPEIVTKTKVRVEEDDEAEGLLALATKTAVQEERDDHMEAPHLWELSTKTFVDEEVDDEAGATSFLLELQTKTEAEVEHDDESRPIL